MANYSYHYLVVRPITEEPDKVEPYIEPLSEITGLDPIMIKQKFTGNAIQVLLTHHEPGYLESLSRDLKKEGFPSVVMSKNEIKKAKKPLRIASLETGQKSIQFVDPEREVILSLDRSERCLIVLSTMEFEAIKRKRMAMLLRNRGKLFSLQDRLSFIYQHHPIMDIYTSRSNTSLRIDGMRFNYNCLGEDNKKSVSLNFPILIKWIKRFSSEAVLETGFGENSLPFLNSSNNLHGERFYREFTIYSHFVFLAHERGIFDTVQDKKISSPVPILHEIEGLLWGGPLFLPINKSSDKESKSIANRESDKKDRDLMPPPKGAIVCRTFQLASLLDSFKLRIKTYRRYIRILGPPVLLYPLTTIAFGSLILGYAAKSSWFFSLGILSLGCILFIHSFILLKRKRAIENCPTSKIRTMPMGEVEVKGYARQKYYLKSPFSNIDCVYYSYKVYEREVNGTTWKSRLKEWGDSGRIPFYVEDDTGRVFVIPENVILRAGITQTFSEQLLASHGIAFRTYGGNNKIIETVIHAGQFLYIKGFAHRLRSNSKEKKKIFIEKLRDLKRDHQRLKRYDLDNDGSINTEEWELAKKDIEDKVLMEGSAIGKEDTIAIGEHPTGRLFYISDKHEEDIISSMNWRIPFFFLLGMVCIVGGSMYLARYLMLLRI